MAEREKIISLEKILVSRDKNENWEVWGTQSLSGENKHPQTGIGVSFTTESVTPSAHPSGGKIRVCRNLHSFNTTMWQSQEKTLRSRVHYLWYNKRWH